MRSMHAGLRRNAAGVRGRAGKGWTLCAVMCSSQSGSSMHQPSPSLEINNIGTNNCAHRAGISFNVDADFYPQARWMTILRTRDRRTPEANNIAKVSLRRVSLH